MVLRKATMDDAQRLFEWRNDPTTREASHNTQPIDLSEHVTWLQRSLSMPSRTIYIAEVDRTPVGMIRGDTINNVTELSWVVAPQWRGLGIGKKIVEKAVGLIEGNLRAEIKAHNLQSISIARSAGLIVEREEKGILHFTSRPR